jgi:hypothetical protein
LTAQGTQYRLSSYAALAGSHRIDRSLWLSGRACEHRLFAPVDSEPTGHYFASDVKVLCEAAGLNYASQD